MAVVDGELQEGPWWLRPPQGLLEGEKGHAAAFLMGLAISEAPIGQ
jgi:hypothetical protein